MDYDELQYGQRVLRQIFTDKSTQDNKELGQIQNRLEESYQSELITPHEINFFDHNDCSKLGVNDVQLNYIDLQMPSQDKSFNKHINNSNQIQDPLNCSNQPEILNIVQNDSIDQSRHFIQSEKQQNERQKLMNNSNKYTNANQKQNNALIDSQQKKSNGIDTSKLMFMNKNFQIITQTKKKLMEFFLNKTYSGRTQLLKNQKIQSFINDACDIRQQSKLNCLKACLDKLCLKKKLKKFKLLKYIPLFNPQHPAYFMTNILFCIFNCSFYTFLSILIVFQAEFLEETDFYDWIYVFWIIEILIKLNTYIYIKTETIKDRKNIFKIYLKKNAIYDIVPFLLSYIKSYFSHVKLLLQILSFVKLKNIVEELTTIQKQLCMVIQKYYYFIQLINLILKLFLVAHAIACLWYLIGQIEIHLLELESTWYSDSIGVDGIWWKLYLQSFYWSLTLMATGSNEAATPLQIFFTSFIMLFTTIIFGYFLNIIGIILSENDEEEINYRKDINIINKYMRKRNISKDLQQNVNLNIEYYYEKNYKKIKEQNDSVLEKLSIHLHEQLLQEYYGTILNKINCLSDHFSKESLDKLSLELEEQQYIPNQIIFNEDSSEDFSMMYVIEGERAMRVAQARAKTFTTILKISRESFLNIIQQNEKDFQQFHFMKDNILQYKNYGLIYVKCSVCNKTSHYTSDCPLVHFNKEEYYGKIRFYEKVQQPRGLILRQQQKTNTLNIQNIIQEQIHQYNQIQSHHSDNEMNNSKLSFEQDDHLNDVLGKSNFPDYEKQINKKNQSLSDLEVSTEKNLNQIGTPNGNNLKPNHQNIQNNLKNNVDCDSPSLSQKDEVLIKNNTLVCQEQNSPLGSEPNIMKSCNQIINHSSLKNMDISRRLSFIKNKPQINISKESGQYYQVDFRKSKLDYDIEKSDIKSNNPWLFETQKDYLIYFPEGNSKLVINRHNRISKRKQKELLKII